MIYLYAYTNHKIGLDHLRRVASIYWNLKEQNIDAEILLNDYRAQLISREWNLPLATTIETIKDIDAVATIDDIVIIDSPETLEGKVLNYPEYFKKVIYINSTCENIEYPGAKILNLFKDGVLYPNLEQIDKIDKTIFILGDSDYEKTILKNLDIFKNTNIDLYWGEYFFVKYEEQLSKIFDTIKESEEYYDVIAKYKNIITSSIQVAIDAKANGAKVAYLKGLKENSCENELSKILNIKLYNDINSIDFKAVKEEETINLVNLNKQINNIINTYV